METCGFKISGSANLNETIYLPRHIENAKYIKLESLSLYNSFHNVCSENSDECTVIINKYYASSQMWESNSQLRIYFKNGLYNLDDIEDEINDAIDKKYDRGYKFIFKIDKSTGCLTIREVKPRGINYSLYISIGSKLRELLGVHKENWITVPFTAKNKLKLFSPNLYLNCSIVDTSIFICNDGVARHKQIISKLPFTEKDIGHRRFLIHHFNPNSTVPCVPSFNSLFFNITDENHKNISFNGYPIEFELSIIF